MSGTIDEVSAFDIGVKVRAGLGAESWRHHGGTLFRVCAAQEQPVLLVIDELPIFLKRMFHNDGHSERADEFPSWLRGLLHALGDDVPILVVSGSIGLEPRVRRLGIPDHINHLYPFRLGPCTREASIECLGLLSVHCS